MSDYLKRLAARNAGILDTVQPRPRGLFGSGAREMTQPAWPADAGFQPEQLPDRPAATLYPPAPATQPPLSTLQTQVADSAPPLAAFVPRLTGVMRLPAEGSTSPPAAPLAASGDGYGLTPAFRPARPENDASFAASSRLNGFETTPRVDGPTIRPVVMAAGRPAVAPDKAGPRVILNVITSAPVRPSSGPPIRSVRAALNLPASALRGPASRLPLDAVRPEVRFPTLAERPILPEAAPALEPSPVTVAQLRVQLRELQRELWRGLRSESPSGREAVSPAAPSSTEQAIHVHIGRIEVRAAPAPVVPRKTPPPATQSLDDYLRRRNGEGGPA